MNFTLRILGTASAMPISDTNPSAQVLSVHGRLFLIDCGEGCQQRLRQMHLGFLKIEAVCISHIHGDHVFGLFGLLSSMAMFNRTESLKVFGPPALGPILRFWQSYFGEGCNYEIEFHSLQNKGLECIYENKFLKISAFPLSHKIECYGYRFDEIISARALSEGRKSRSYAYCSDTMPFADLENYVRGVSVLYHETTYLKDMNDRAQKHAHSTTADAAGLALRAGVGKLLVGHYSSRVRDRELFQNECREIFEQSYALLDCEVVEID